MIDPFYIFAVIVAIVLFYVIPILIIYFIFKWTKKKLNSKIAYTILAVMMFIFLFITYADFFPLENSYKRNFKENTELNFPKSAVYLEKTSSTSIFNFDGNMYCSKIKIDNNDYLKIKKEIEKSKFIKVDSYTKQTEPNKIFSKIKGDDIDKIYRLQRSGNEYLLFFLSDKKTLILFYRSWF